MTTHHSMLSKEQLGWLLLAGGVLLLAAMAYWVIPANQQASLLLQLSLAVLIVGGGLTFGLLKLKDR